MGKLNPLLRAILNSCQKYKEGKFDVEGLQLSVDGNAAAMDGTVAPVIRNFLDKMEVELDTIRFSLEGKEQREQVLELISELEELLKETNE